MGWDGMAWGSIQGVLIIWPEGKDTIYETEAGRVSHLSVMQVDFAHTYDQSDMSFTRFFFNEHIASFLHYPPSSFMILFSPRVPPFEN